MNGCNRGWMDAMYKRRRRKLIHRHRPDPTIATILVFLYTTKQKNSRNAISMNRTKLTFLWDLLLGDVLVVLLCESSSVYLSSLGWCIDVLRWFLLWKPVFLETFFHFHWRNDVLSTNDKNQLKRTFRFRLGLGAKQQRNIKRRLKKALFYRKSAQTKYAVQSFTQGRTEQWQTMVERRWTQGRSETNEQTEWCRSV